MRCLMKLTKPLLKLVCCSIILLHTLVTISNVELEALQVDEEEEGPSYLTDLNKVPDFVDEPPLESQKVMMYYRAFASMD